MTNADHNKGHNLRRKLQEILNVNERELLERMSSYNERASVDFQLSQRTIQNWMHSGVRTRNQRARDFLDGFLRSSGIEIESIDELLEPNELAYESKVGPARDAGTKRFVQMASELERNNRYLESQRNEYAGVYSVYTRYQISKSGSEDAFRKHALVLWPASNLATLIDSNELTWNGVSVFTGESCSIVFSRRYGPVPATIIHMMLALSSFWTGGVMRGLMLRTSQVNRHPVASKFIAIKEKAEISSIKESLSFGLDEEENAPVSGDLGRKLGLGVISRDDPTWETISMAISDASDSSNEPLWLE